MSSWINSVHTRRWHSRFASEHIAEGVLDRFRAATGDNATAIYAANVIGGVSVKVLARLIGCTPRGIRHTLARVEDQRDDPDLDQTLNTLALEFAT